MSEAQAPASRLVALWVGVAVGAAVGVAMWTSPAPWTLVMDTGNVFLGQTLPAFSTWMTGTVPEWSDLLWGGFPLLGDCTTAALYPLHLLAYAATVSAPLRFFDVAFALHLALFAAGSSMLLRTLGAGTPTTAIGGILAALCPFAHYCGIAFFPVLGAQAWWPWAFVAAELLSRPQTRLVGGAMVLGWVSLAAQVLVGVPEQATYCAVVTAAWLLTRRTGLGVTARVARLAVLGVGTAAVSAPQLLPTMEYVPWTNRAGDPGLAELASLWLTAPERLLVAGRGARDDVPSFVGAVTLALAAVAVVSRQARALFLVMTAAVGFALALGPQAGLYEWLHRVPPFDSFRSPVKLYAFAEFGVTWAAALGLDALWRRRAAWMRAAAAVLAVGALAERAAYLGGSEVLAFAGIHAADGLTPDVPALLADSMPVRARKPGEPPPLVLDVQGPNGGGYARSVGAVVGMSSLRAGTVALLLAAHAKVPWRHPAIALGVRYALVVNDECARLSERYGWPSVEQTRDYCILQSTVRADRYTLVRRIAPVASEADMYAAMRRHPTGPLPVVAPADAFGMLRGGAVTIHSYRPGHTVLTAMSIAPTLLLARETRAPGWEVRVDGRRVTPYPAAGVYFAVPVERGVHSVELTYRAPGFRTGLAVLAGWIAVAGVAAIATRRA